VVDSVFPADPIKEHLDHRVVEPAGEHYRNNWVRLLLYVFPRTTPPGSNHYFTCVKSAETSSTSRTFTRMTP
jgi:hypothetical protein